MQTLRYWTLRVKHPAGVISAHFTTEAAANSTMATTYSRVPKAEWPEYTVTETVIDVYDRATHL